MRAIARYAQCMGRRALGTRLAACGLASFVAVAAACEEDDPIPAVNFIPEAMVPDESGAAHLGQIRVVAEGLASRSEMPRVQVEGRFASYVGMDAAFARARANMRTPAVDLLAVGSCRSARELASLEAELAGKPLPPALRELSLVDAGSLELGVGGRALTVPYALVPDLNDWLGGVEYRLGLDDEAVLLVDPTGAAPLQVSWMGSPEADLPPATIEARLPPALRDFSARLAGETLSLTWEQGRPFTWPLELAVYTVDASGARQSETVICAVDDRGAAELRAADLREAGLEISSLVEGERIVVEGRRLQRTSIGAGAFDEIELLMESRERTWVELASTLAP